MKDMNANQEANSDVVYVTVADEGEWRNSEPRPLGVYSSFEKAKAAALKRIPHFYGVDIYEVSVDGSDRHGFGDSIWFWNQQHKKGQDLR